MLISSRQLYRGIGKGDDVARLYDDVGGSAMVKKKKKKKKAELWKIPYKPNKNKPKSPQQGFCV